jgi:hypothetical protein
MALPDTFQFAAVINAVPTEALNKDFFFLRIQNVGLRM